MSNTPPRNPLEDPALGAYRDFLLRRAEIFQNEKKRIEERYGSLRSYANIYKNLGPHLINEADGEFWRWREYMPNAEAVWLTTAKLNFQRFASHKFKNIGNGYFELTLPKSDLPHGEYIELRVQPYGHDANAAPGSTTPPLRRIPAFAQWVEQDATMPTQWCARMWAPQEPYQFKNPRPGKLVFPRIYEAHVGMAQSSLTHHGDSYGTYEYFRRFLLPRIRNCGYTVVQLMGILEHPLYRSFGYQVSNYFAPSHRYGNPDEFKALVDEAHGLGLAVILDITHGHAAANTEQGIAQYDGSNYFFSAKVNQWGTPSFDYGIEMTRRFLLSNCRYWMEEFRIDGFRFDAVGNTLYIDHGRDDDFSHVGRCFYGKNGEPREDVNGELYLCLANALTHELDADAITIAEEFSGMPGLTCPPSEGGLGFNYRFAMGIPDFWEKAIEQPREMGSAWYEMTNHRPYDRTISYVECHDQCINGDDAFIWRLIGDDMYRYMAVYTDKWNVSRGLAFYKLMRLLTLCTADAGYLNFMGNEFGHPEWLDAEEHAHRQWHLADQSDLKYSGLALFDKAELKGIVGQHLKDFSRDPLFRFIHEDWRILAFERGRLLFVFNFHETEARQDLLFAVTPGKYVELLSTDEKRFAGHGNLEVSEEPLEHFTIPLSYRPEQDIKLYLPPMTALVLHREN
ncbi:MAG: 1,4-alpha-glucan branching protein [Desulfovibrio sp.]|nr:1,4-alpha-glucan branching protein [Desulfovibrio sp.]